VGREKEEQIVREEPANARARQDGFVCDVCGGALLESIERRQKLCTSCAKQMADDSNYDTTPRLLAD
jgi:hypothetical protein